MSYWDRQGFSYRVKEIFFILMSQWSWAKKTGREQFDLGFVYLSGSLDNLLNWCFMPWAFAGHVKTACWQLISYLRNMCVMAVVSEVSFESNFLCASFGFIYLECGSKAVGNEDSSCLCAFLQTQGRQKNMN